MTSGKQWNFYSAVRSLRSGGGGAGKAYAVGGGGFSEGIDCVSKIVI